MSFAIEEGEVFGLLGPNGAGKRTTIAMLSGLFPPSEGAAQIGGLDVVKDLGRVKQLIGIVPQELALYPTLTGRENVTFFGEMYGLHGKDLRQRVDFDYLVPGYAVFFAFFLLGLMAETVYNERVSGGVRRLLVQPTPRWVLLLGKAIPYALIAMLQVMVVMGASSLLFGYDLGHDLPALALLVVATGLVVGSIGLLMAVLVKSEGQVNAVPTLLPLVLAAVSGAMFPSIAIPTLKLFTPHYWAVQGFYQVKALGGDLTSALPHIGILLAISVLCFGLAVLRFRYE